jgi:hypothetical protein
MTALETRAPRNILTHLPCEREEEIIEVRPDGLTIAFLASSIRSRQTCFIRACEFDHCEPSSSGHAQVSILGTSRLHVASRRDH